MAKKDPESPDTTSYAYDDMEPSWCKIQTVLDGTEAMRASERTYLPQHTEESDTAYRERLERATLLNLTKLTLNSWVGRPFSEPIKFSEDMSEEMKTFLEDVDQTGTDVQVFARNWFADGIAKALSHVLVDFPRVSEEDRPQTLADDGKLKPYWTHIRPEQLIFADVEVVNGQEVLREIRFREDLVEREGFAEKVVPQIRRMYIDTEGSEPRGYVEIYQIDEKSRKRKKPWIMVDSYPYSLSVIPLVTFYSDRDGFMHGVPPLEDLVDLNIAHWQSTSDQRAILTVARFPILALSGGVDEDQKLTIGPHKWLFAPDPHAKFYYVEHDGAAIDSGRQDLQDLESQMAEYGAEFLKKRPGGVTATARALDSAEATSPLQDITLRFKHSLDLVLYYTGLWLGNEQAVGSVELETDFGPEEVNQAELSAIQFARTNRDISRVTFLEELKRRGALSEEYDIEADEEQLEKESMSLGIGGGLPGEDVPEDNPEEEAPEEEPASTG